MQGYKSPTARISRLEEPSLRVGALGPIDSAKITTTDPGTGTNAVTYQNASSCPVLNDQVPHAQALNTLRESFRRVLPETSTCGAPTQEKDGQETDPAEEESTGEQWNSQIQTLSGQSAGYYGPAARENSRQHNGHNIHNTAGGHSASGGGIVHVGHITHNKYKYKLQRRKLGEISNEDQINEDLLIAAFEGQTQRVAHLIWRLGANVDYQDDQGLTALHYACINGDEDPPALELPSVDDLHEVVQLLIDAGADRNAQSEDLGTPLCLAALRGQMKAVRTLLAYKANVHVAGWSVGTPLHCASYGGSVEVVKKLIKYHADPNRTCSVQLELLEHGSVLDSAFAGILSRTCKGSRHRIIDCKPLYIATARRHENLVNYFENARCSVNDTYRVWFCEHPEASDASFENTMQAFKTGQCTLLMAASSQGDLRLVSRLVSFGASLDATDTKGRSALYYSSMGGHIACVQHLLDSGAAVDLQDNGMTTPFFIAAYQGYAQIMETLADRGANIDHQIMNGDTALHLAARHGRLKVAQSLLSLRADYTQRNKFGLTPMDLAEEKQHAEIVDCLDNHNADSSAARANDLAAALDVAPTSRVEVVRSRSRVETGRIMRRANRRILAKHAANIISRLDLGPTEPMDSMQSTNDPIERIDASRQKPSRIEIVCID